MGYTSFRGGVYIYCVGSVLMAQPPSATLSHSHLPSSISHSIPSEIFLPKLHQKAVENTHLMIPISPI